MEQPSLDIRFGKYIPIRFLTHWTLGERFIAMSEDAGPNDPPVIVDRLWEEFTRFDGIYDELERIRRWMLFSHPALVNVIDVGMTGSRPYVVSEYFEGLPLETYFQRQDTGGDPIPRRKVLEIGVQLALGLDALHKAQDGPWPLGLFHGGLGSTRVLIDNRWRARMLAGWSTPLERRLAWATPPRAAAYQAPEYLWGRPKPDHRADLYSLGVILYDALVGRFCPNDDPLSYVRRVLRRDAEEAGGFDGLPAPLARVLRQLLSPDPEHRPSDAGVVANVLRSVIEAESRAVADRAEEKPVEPTGVPTSKIKRPEEPHRTPSPTLAASSKEAPSTEEPVAGRAAASMAPAPEERVARSTSPEPEPVGTEVPPDEPEEPDISIRLTTVVPAAGRPAEEEAPVQRAGARETAIEDVAPEESGKASSPSSAESLWFGTPVAEAPPAEEAASKKDKAQPPVAPTPEETKAQPTTAPGPSELAADEKPVEESPVPAIEPEKPDVAPQPGVEADQEKPGIEAKAPVVEAKPKPEPAAEAARAEEAKVEQPSEKAVLSERPVAEPVVESPSDTQPEVEEEEPSRPLALQEPLPTKPRGFLVYREGSSQEYLFPLAGDVVKLGRSSNNTYQILSEIKASRFHCEFQYEQDASGKGRWLLVDRRSTNGTYVNGRPIDVYELKGREKINIGYTTFRFLMADEDGNPIDATPEKRRDDSLDTTEIPLLRAALVLNEGKPNESRHEIKGEVFLIGSGAGNSLQIKGPKVAPCHCEIRVQDGTYVIEDHMSEHGTLVNGFLVDQLALDGGEEISVGDVTMRFVVFE